MLVATGKVMATVQVEAVMAMAITGTVTTAMDLSRSRSDPSRIMSLFFVNVSGG